VKGGDVVQVVGILVLAAALATLCELAAWRAGE
jgi:hypothetical protein